MDKLEYIGREETILGSIAAARVSFMKSLVTFG